MEYEEVRNDYYDDYSEATDAMPPSDIVTYTELRSIADLFRMHKQGALDVQPDFQREEVWSAASQTRFIDSLVKQLPIPSLCLGFDFKKQKWQVIDGLQRLRSAFRFLDTDNPWKMGRLDDIDPRLSGRNNTDFQTDSNLQLVRRIVENTVLPITVVRCNSEDSDHKNYLFKIFRRLNTGGVKLSNQEIRNCIYGGPFNDMLNEINSSELWIEVSPFKKPFGYRFRGQEMILRIFAFSDSYSSYKGNLASFLNDFMDEHKDCDNEVLEKMHEGFVATLKAIEKIDRDRIAILSKTVFEALMVGMYSNRSRIDELDKIALTQRLDEMLKRPQFSKESLSEGLSSREKLVSRIKTACEVFQQ